MSEFSPPPHDEEIEQLLLNARLRDELEPFLDDSIFSIKENVPTPVENAYLASMLAWERAPVVPISKWFEPELVIPHPDLLNETGLHQALWDVAERLFEKRVVLDFTDHLTNRQLYTLIYRDILPAQEKKIDHADSYLHWDCAGGGDDAEIWLRFYASDEEREGWAEHWPDPLPPKEIPPYPRELPRRPL